MVFSQIWKVILNSLLDQMGCCGSSVDEKRILLLGLKGSGKNQILCQLQSKNKKQTIHHFQTKDFDSQSLAYEGYTVYSWDLNGVENSRPIWRHYFNDAKAIIFVVDSTAEDQLDKIKEEIHQIVKISEIKNCPILIFANKQDIEGALSPDQIKEKINIDSIPQQKQTIIGSNANNGDGIFTGMKWVLSSIK